MKEDLQLATTEQLIDELMNRLDVMKVKYVFAMQLDEDGNEDQPEKELTVIVYDKKYLKKAQKWFMKVFGGIALD